MAKVIKTKYGQYVEGYIKIRGFINDKNVPDEIPDEQAITILYKFLEEISGSNDGSEILACAKPILSI